MRSAVCLHPVSTEVKSLCPLALPVQHRTCRVVKEFAAGVFLRRLPMPHNAPWTLAEDKLLGTASDSVIAKRLKRTRAAVMQRRFRLNISCFGWTSRARHSKWGPTEIALFLRCSDDEMARITGRGLTEVQAKRAELKSSD